MGDLAITLRPVRPEDAPFLLSVYASTRLEELARVDWTEAQRAAFLQQQFMAQERHYQHYFPDAHYDLILRQGAPVGRLWVDRTDAEIHILDLTLLPEHRGAGIGSGLLSALQAEGARERKSVWIYVEDFSPALALLRRLGFVPVAEQGVHLRMEWRPGDQMQKLEA